jgi:glycosyltransferase involved in cell wall biosynthesis
MEKKPNIVVLIPAYNEEASIGKVIAEIPRDWVSEIIVCNNNSKDNTATVAIDAGATVVFQPLPGYGNACLKGIEYLKNKTQKPDIVIFIDGDYSDYPAEMPSVFLPIIEQKYDIVIGSRTLGRREKGAITPQQIFGNWLATTLIRWIYGYRFSDLGPFRAISWEALMLLDMKDKNYGWTVEMQIKAAKKSLKCTEVAVNYRQRIGISKVSGTVKGTIMAGYKILLLIFKYSF